MGAARSRFEARHLSDLHRVLFSAFSDESAGSVRTEQNWIGGTSGSPRDAEFVPPAPEFVASLLDDLARFVARDDLSPVLQAAVAHAQFETIHPFADGNGRVGRCLIHVILTRRGATPRVVPSISLVLATDSGAYVRGLTSFRAGEIKEWVGAFSAAARTAVAWTEAAGPLRRPSAAAALLERLAAAPILDVATVEELVAAATRRLVSP